MLGIVGGLGPLASAEFVKTLYEYNLSMVEQTLPKCFLYSDPSFPDRSEAILNHSTAKLMERLVETIQHLIDLGSQKIILCCTTIHSLLPRLPEELKQYVISLIDLIMNEVIERQEKCLLLCTHGSRQSRVFQNHELWTKASPFIVVPNDDDQEKIHAWIYQIKKNKVEKSLLAELVQMTDKYNVNALISGCTEYHLITKKFVSDNAPKISKINFIDPLMRLAKNLDRYY
ncbi:aspartate/glutamate racemase family protein [Leptothoe kymatousa]|uniref:Aspartate/glutamate racemase family protein n=1 Tax=Leptothoe kymatousa TAU-MAC 1615 TaxID=2364775 RepID=A0ABS5Y4L2_9CYAN|nr:amino acid racemase [Leptothoe kymatousa]MBT9312780.1 aspartate/glutamate racemase family protein [Leptothoe kymatousa TAU-MAC 1615]